MVQKDAIALSIYETVFETGMESVVVPPQFVVAGGTLIKPDNPECAGYIWKGWYTERTGGSMWDFGINTVSQDMTLYGRWDDVAPSDAAFPRDDSTLPEGRTR